MRWEGRRESDHVEDRRRMSPKTAVAGGGLGMIVVIVLVLLLGGDPQKLLQQAQQQQQRLPQGGNGQVDRVDPAEERLAHFSRVVLADTEDVWIDLFRRGLRREYEQPTLVLFRNAVQSACGNASSAVGPFYCPADGKVYLDLGFFEQLRRRYQAQGDFAQAYVIAHEVGHHVQKLLGVSDEVNRLQRQVSKEEANQLSVRLELQADFYAGVWAHHAHQMSNILEPGDVEEAIEAARAIGDDNLQKQAQGYVVPESFTHGTSQQRARWFRKGLQTGDMKAGDTFSARDL